MATNNATNNAGGGGSLTLIQTQNVSSVASVLFTSGIVGSVNNYFLLADQLNNPAGTASYLMLQLSIDGGATYISTNYNSSSFTNGLIITFFNDLSTDVNNSEMFIQNLTSGIGYITMVGIDSGWDSVGMATTGGQQLNVYTVLSTTANAFRIVTDDGSVFSGLFSLYGYSQ